MTLTATGVVVNVHATPLTIGDKLVVRLRRVTLMKAAGMRWVGYRITHPHGRKNLGPSDFAIRESAMAYAKAQGWYVMGPQS